MSNFTNITKEKMLQIPAEEICNSNALYANPLVSIVMMTRNHENYIRQAVESVIDQELDFPIEILIGEDFSTDDTRQECEKLQQEYPQVIRLIVADKNVGITPNFLRLVCRARGKYIALLEGDDYWIHPKKLALQVQLMENHPEYSWCGGKTINRTFWVEEKSSFDFEDTLRHYIIHISSVFFRADILNKYPSFPDIVGWISMVYVYLAQHGDCGFINEYLSYYRRHIGGLYTGKTSIEHIKLAHSFTDTIDEYLEYQYSKHLYFRELWICKMETSIDIDNFLIQKWRDSISGLFFELKRTKLIRLLPIKSVGFTIAILFQPLTFLYLYTRRRLALKSRIGGLIRILKNI